MKRSVFFSLFVSIPILTSCGGGSSGGVVPANASNATAPVAGGSSSTVSKAPKITEKSVAPDVLRGGITLGADGFVYASGQKGLQVSTQSLVVQPATGTATPPPDTWPVIPKRLAPTGAVTASSTTIGALATLPTAAPASAVPNKTGAENQTPALARFETSTKTWFDVDFGKRGDVWADVAPDAHAGFFIAGDTPGGSGFTGFATEVPVFCVLMSVSLPQPVGAIALGADGFPWVSSTDTVPGTNFKNPSVPSQLYHVGPGNTIAQTITLPSGSRVNAMVVGPDNALWFTDGGLNAIGRVAPDGSVSFVTLKGGNGLEPDGITVGSDGSLWFTETHGNKIGQITTSGVVTETKIPTANANAQDIVGCVNGTCAASAVFFAEHQAFGKAAF